MWGNFSILSHFPWVWTFIWEHRNSKSPTLEFYLIMCFRTRETKAATKFHQMSSPTRSLTKLSFIFRTSIWLKTSTCCVKFDANPRATSRSSWWPVSKRSRSSLVTGKWSVTLFVWPHNWKFLQRATALRNVIFIWYWTWHIHFSMCTSVIWKVHLMFRAY